MLQVRQPPRRKPLPVRIAIVVRPESRQLRRLAKWALPSWLCSLLFHAGVMLAVWTCFTNWHSGAGGLGDGLSTEFSLLGGEATSSSFSIRMDGASDAALGASGDAVESTSVSGEQPPPEVQTTAVVPLTAELSLPTTAGLLNGTFAPAVNSVGSGVPGDSPARNFIKGDGGAGGGGRPGGGGGIGGTAFMGISDRATRVVWVIDSSGSMLNNHAMQAAKAALLASLQSLSDAQQFQVIFFNDHPTALHITGNGDPTLAFATEVNKAKARQEIAAISPDLGTNRLEAIQLALRFGPEVIYLLTDIDDPILTAKELEQIQRLSKGKARIHCIEFGKEAALDTGPQNFLQKLARQNGGNHIYKDVKRLGERQ